MKAATPLISIQLRRLVTDALGLVPHLMALFDALVLSSLDRRLRALVSLAVTRSKGATLGPLMHHVIATGGDRDILDGGDDALTQAERSAMTLALGTICRLPAEDDVDNPPDQHFTSEQIRQLQALALAIDLYCLLMTTGSSRPRRSDGQAIGTPPSGGRP